MALEGNVKDFGLSEIFQLISLQKKSGMLSVTGEKPMVIFFREGKIISTRDRRDRTSDPLKDFLLRYGFIGNEDMSRIERIQAETNMDLTDILVSEKFFSEDEIRIIFTEQIQESVQAVLSWPRSYYKFIIGTQVLRGVKSYAALQVEGILMESMRRIDEFPELQRIFPSEKMTLKRLEMPPENTQDLDSHEEFIYDILENMKSLETIVACGRMSRFCTYEALKNLLEKELLQIVEEPKPAAEIRPEMVRTVIKKKQWRFLPTLAAVFILFGCFALGEYGIPFLLPPGWSSRRAASAGAPAPPSPGYLASGLDELRLRQLEATVEESLEEYLAVKGSYPFTLEILAVREFLSAKTIDDLNNSGIGYRIGESGMSYSLQRIRRR